MKAIITKYCHCFTTDRFSLFHKDKTGVALSLMVIFHVAGESSEEHMASPATELHGERRDLRDTSAESSAISE